MLIYIGRCLGIFCVECTNAINLFTIGASAVLYSLPLLSLLTLSFYLFFSVFVPLFPYSIFLSYLYLLGSIFYPSPCFFIFCSRFSIFCHSYCYSIFYPSPILSSIFLLAIHFFLLSLSLYSCFSISLFFFYFILPSSPLYFLPLLLPRFPSFYSVPLSHPFTSPLFLFSACLHFLLLTYVSSLFLPFSTSSSLLSCILYPFRFVYLPLHLPYPLTFPFSLIIISYSSSFTFHSFNLFLYDYFLT